LTWLAIQYAKQTSHTLRVRVYRPGFALVEICAWTGVQDVHWREAKTLAAQEKTIDDLLAPTVKGSEETKRKPFAHLDPGSVSVSHHDALLFGSRSRYHLGLASARTVAQFPQRCVAMEPACPLLG